MILAVISDSVKIAVAPSIASVLVSAISAYFAYRGKVLATKTKAVSDETRVVAEKTHEIVNSRMTAFMVMAKEFYRLEGARQEKLDESVRKAAAIVSEAKGAANAGGIPPVTTPSK